MTFLLKLFSLCGVAVILGVVRSEGKRLIKTSEHEPPEWLDDAEITALHRNGLRYIDVTNFEYLNVKPGPVNTRAIPTTLRFQETVKSVSANLNTPRAQEFLKHFSDYRERLGYSELGRDAQLWLYSQVDASIGNYAGNATVFEVDHGYRQRSIIARFEGADPELREEVVIIGAHMDSRNYLNDSMPAPGADDDGSGVVTVLETLRAIVESQVILNRTIEFIFYAAHEQGLVGSLALAADYRKRDVFVASVLHLDIVGHHKPGHDRVGIYTDYAEPMVVQFLRILTDGYLTYGKQDRTCGYACSDHDSWHRNGFPAVLAAEVIGHNYMHTEWDTYDTVDFAQVAEFIKLSIGYVIEIGEPQTPMA